MTTKLRRGAVAAVLLALAGCAGDTTTATPPPSGEMQPVSVEGSGSQDAAAGGSGTQGSAGAEAGSGTK